MLIYEILFLIFKIFLFVSFVGTIVSAILSMYLIYRAATIKEDVTIAYAMPIKINKILIINSFATGSISILITTFLRCLAL